MWLKFFAFCNFPQSLPIQNLNFHPDCTGSLAKKNHLTTLKHLTTGNLFLGSCRTKSPKKRRLQSPSEKEAFGVAKQTLSTKTIESDAPQSTFQIECDPSLKGLRRTRRNKGTRKHDGDAQECGAGSAGGRVCRGLHATARCVGCAATPARSGPSGPPISKVLTSPGVADELQSG